MIRRLLFLLAGLLLGTTAALAFAQQPGKMPAKLTPKEVALWSAAHYAGIEPDQRTDITVQLVEPRHMYGNPRTPDGQLYCWKHDDKGRDYVGVCS